MSAIIIFHSPLPEGAPPDETDVLQEAVFFHDALIQTGFKVITKPFPYHQKDLMKLTETVQPIFVVNLVETLFSSGKLVHFAPFLFEHIRIPYTGCSAHAMYISSHKVLSKQLMQAHGIKTPRYFSWEGLKHAPAKAIHNPFLIKSIWEHASFGLHENYPLLFESKEELLANWATKPNPEEYFCEEYIHGREFNLSLIEGPQGMQVLPPAELVFSYPSGKPHILGYKAKWDTNSFEYRNTNRTFSFSPDDRSLINRLKSIALQCSDIFELRGYARVDFRVDDQENIFVLEINANPCISEDSGFVAAARMEGLSDTETVKRIIMHLPQGQAVKPNRVLHHEDKIQEKHPR